MLILLHLRHHAAAAVVTAETREEMGLIAGTPRDLVHAATLTEVSHVTVSAPRWFQTGELANQSYLLLHITQTHITSCG